MGRCCRCRKIQPQEEKSIMIRAFISFLVVQTLTLDVLCGITIYELLSADFDWFLTFDLLTLVIAVIILSFMILVSGFGAATSNTFFTWILFHLFMGVLFIIELLTSWFSSDVDGFLRMAHRTWVSGTDAELRELQDDLLCCGFFNTSDHPPSVVCPDHFSMCCRDKLYQLMSVIRNTASVSLFADFVFAMFIDFAGCAICFHPDTISLDQQVKEEESMNQERDSYYLGINSPPRDDGITHRKRQRLFSTED